MKTNFNMSQRAAVASKLTILMFRNFKTVNLYKLRTDFLVIFMYALHTCISFMDLSKMLKNNAVCLMVV